MKPTDVTFKFPLGYTIPQQSHIQVSVADTKKTKPTGVEFPDVPTQALVMLVSPRLHVCHAWNHWLNMPLSFSAVKRDLLL
jgi:hypothetical protein